VVCRRTRVMYVVLMLSN